MRLIQEKQNNKAFSFSTIGGKGKQLASASGSFLIYPKLIVFLLVLTLALLLVRVYVSNQLAVSGGFVSLSSSKVDDLTSENYKLENKLSQISSLSYVEAQTARLGLVKIADVEVLKGSGGVALNQ